MQHRNGCRTFKNIVVANMPLLDGTNKTGMIQGFNPSNPVQEFIEQFAESLESIGLINYSDGTRKKAWNEFIYWTESLNRESVKY